MQGAWGMSKNIFHLPASQSSGFSVLSLCRRFTLLNPPQEGRKAAFNRVNFERFEQVYEERFERQYGFFRSYVRQVIYRYLDCGILHKGFARVRCEDCGHEYLLALTCYSYCTSFARHETFVNKWCSTESFLSFFCFNLKQISPGSSYRYCPWSSARCAFNLPFIRYFVTVILLTPCLAASSSLVSIPASRKRS